MASKRLDTVFFVVALISVLNIIAYLNVRDWNSLAVFAIVGSLAFAVKATPTVSLIAAILAANLFRASSNLREGMEVKKEKEKPKKKKMAIDIFGDTTEGLKNISNVQKTLSENMSQLSPMIEQMSSVMKNMPEGFIEKAMANFNKQYK